MKNTNEKLLQQVEESPKLTITPPRFHFATFLITGTKPYVQNKFAEKIWRQMLKAQQEGSSAKNKKKRPARKPQEEFEAAQHRIHIPVTGDVPKGANGIPVAAFRNAMISACRVAGFVMTKARLSVFCEPDGYDEAGTGLVYLQAEPSMCIHPVRLEKGVASVSVRAMWTPGWKAKVKVMYDADQFQVQDIANLLARAGLQVGIGEGRPDSKQSNGQGWGLFNIDQSTVEEVYEHSDLGKFQVEQIEAEE